MELAVIALGYLILRRSLQDLSTGQQAAIAPRAPSPRLKQLTDYADRLYAERKWLAAEKAYLSVLKLDHRNVTAYSRLGVIYSTQKNYADAIECFQIAARLKPSGTTMQNLALAFYDNRNYMKSVAAYEKSIMFEPTVLRYLGLAKAYRHLANTASALEALDKADELGGATKTKALRAEIAAEKPAAA